MATREEQQAEVARIRAELAEQRTNDKVTLAVDRLTRAVLLLAEPVEEVKAGTFDVIERDDEVGD